MLRDDMVCIRLRYCFSQRKRFAGVAELADAYGSGPYGGNPMKVQVLSPAPSNMQVSPCK